MSMVQEPMEAIVAARIEIYSGRLSEGRDLWTGEPLHPFLVKELQKMAKQRAKHSQEQDGDETGNFDG